MKTKNNPVADGRDVTTLAEQLRTTNVEHLGPYASQADLELYRAELRRVWPVGEATDIDSDVAQKICERALGTFAKGAR